MNPLATARAWLTQRLRAWLLGPQLHAEIAAAVQRVHAIGQREEGACVHWQAVPVRGRQRIELVMAEANGCGFYIELDPGSTIDRLYQLFDPEGRRMAWGPNLNGLKNYGEQLARERCEFVPHPTHRDHWRH